MLIVIKLSTGGGAIVEQFPRPCPAPKQSPQLIAAHAKSAAIAVIGHHVENVATVNQ